MKVSRLVLLLLCAVSLIQALPYQCGQIDPPEVPPMSNDDMELAQVSITFRHGDRIMYQDVPCWPNDEGVFQCEDRHLSTPSFYENETKTHTGRVFRKKYMNGRNYYAGNCETGQLTNKGYIQERNTGSMYRKKYVGSGFLPPSFDPTIMYLRSDTEDRCIQSMETLLEGFFPSNATEPQLDIFDIHTLDPFYDNITPNSNICPILDQYYNEAFSTPEYQAHYTKYTVPLYNSLSKALGYTVNSVDTFQQIHDCLIVHACNEQPIPSGLTPRLYNAVMAEFEYQYHMIYNYPDTRSYAQAGIGFLLQEMSQYWLNVVNNVSTQQQYKLTLWSGHDTTLVPLLAAFEQWNGVWTMYASQIQFELYRSKSVGDFHMRVTFNGKELILPNCGQALCPWDTFYTFIQTILPNGKC